MDDTVYMVKDLVEACLNAIRNGDWVVDGACDPEIILNKCDTYLRQNGFVKDGISGMEYINA